MGAPPESAARSTGSWHGPRRLSSNARELCSSSASRPRGPWRLVEANWDQAEPVLAPVWDHAYEPIRVYGVEPGGENGEEEVGNSRWPPKATVTRLARIVSHEVFQGTMALLIFANAVVIGLETDVDDDAVKEIAVWDTVEDVFLLVFLVELVLRLAAIGCKDYWSCEGQDFMWNAFDFLIVSLGLFDFIFGLLFGRKGNGRLATIFRIIRLCRILRVLRIVKFLKQLYVLAFGFALAAVAVFWVTFLMIFVLYVCSIILVRTQGKAHHDEPHADFLKSKFGNVPLAMFTLFELMSSPNLVEYQEIMAERPLMAAFLVAFIVFGSFGMIALLTGVISESMFEKNALRMEEERVERENNRKRLFRTCAELFNDLRVSDTGKADRRDIILRLPHLAKIFEELSVAFNQDDLMDMMQCLDRSGSGYVAKEELQKVVVQMAEGVKPLMLLDLGSRLSVVEGQLARVESLVQGVSQQQKDYGEQVQTSKNVVEEAVSRLADIAERLEHRLGTLDYRLEEMSEDIAALKGLHAETATFGARLSQRIHRGLSATPNRLRPPT